MKVTSKTVKLHPVYILIPKTLNGKPYTLNNLISFSDNCPWLKGRIKIDPLVKKQYGDEKPKHSYWIEISSTILSESKGSSRNIPSALSKFPSHSSPGVLEACTFIVVTHMLTQAQGIYPKSAQDNFTTVCTEDVNDLGEGLLLSFLSKVIHTPVGVSYFPKENRLHVRMVDTDEYDYHTGTFACKKL